MATRTSKMDVERFWQLIEEARERSGGDPEGLVEELHSLLVALAPAELIAFDELLFEHRRCAYRWPLWGAAYLMNGGCSDDGFEYFRCGLIAQGRRVYTAALENPDSLADHMGPGGVEELEDLLYVAMRAYEERTGEEMPLSERGFPDEPAGRRWTEEELESLFPRIAARLAEG